MDNSKNMETGSGQRCDGQGNFHPSCSGKAAADRPVTPPPCLHRMTREHTGTKEASPFRKPQGFRTVRFHLTAEATEWLCGTTKDDDGRETGNFTLFGDLLARMALTAGESKGFRRPLTLSAGQAQYSEEQLSAQWNMGRKRIRNLLDTLTDLGLIATCRSRVASVMTFPCIHGWKIADGGYITNPFTHEQREE